jgi:hypothetical protein
LTQFDYRRSSPAFGRFGLGDASHMRVLRKLRPQTFAQCACSHAVDDPNLRQPVKKCAI